MTSVRVEVITSIGALEDLRADWDRLVTDSPRVTAFASPAAVITWFSLTQGHSNIHALAIWQSDRLAGFAPFSSLRMGPFTLYVTAGAGFGYYGEPLLGTEPTQVVEAIVGHISQETSSGWAAFYLRRIRADGALASMLERRDDVSVQLMSPDEEVSVVRFGEMPDTDQYFKAKAKKHEVRRLYRRLGEQFEGVEYVVDDPEPGVALDTMRDMYYRRFDTDLRIFSTPQNRSLLYALAESLIDAGKGRVSSLMASGRRVAVTFIPHVDSRFMWYAVAYEPELRKYGLGHVEPFEMLSSTFAAGATEVDLGDARFAYKQTWANAGFRHRTVAVTAPGLRGRVAGNLRRLAIRRHRLLNLDDAPVVGPHII